MNPNVKSAILSGIGILAGAIALYVGGLEKAPVWAVLIGHAAAFIANAINQATKPADPVQPA